MTKPLSPHPSYRPDIDGLRAIAVVLVIIYHAFPKILPSGFIGVDVFFVISGFLISTIIFNNLSNHSFSLIDFYSRRINRIFPSLSLILFFALIAGWFLLIPDDYEKLNKHIFGGAIFVSNLVSRSEFGYFDDASELKPLLHLWSLGIEEQFYIIWPVLLVMAFRLRLNFFILTITTLLGSFFLNIYKSGFDTTFAFYSPQTRAWELLIGAMLALLFPYLKHTLHRFTYLINICNISGFALIIVGLLSINKHVSFPGWWALSPSLGAALIIASGTQAWINKNFLSFRLLVSVGLISYPLYLWHWVLLSFLNLKLGTYPSDLYRFIAVIISFFLAYLSYIAVEKPLRSRFNKHRVALILLLVMMSISLTSLYIYKKRGLFGQTDKTLLISDQAIYSCPKPSAHSLLCVFGNLESNKTIVIYGDSHAEHLTNALNSALGDQYKLVFAYAPSCFFTNDKSLSSTSSINCAKAIDSLNDLANSLKGQKIEAVIRSQRWHGYGFNNEQSLAPVLTDAMNTMGINTKKVVIVGSTADVDLRCEKYNYYFDKLADKKICADSELTRLHNKAFIHAALASDRASNVFFIFPYNKLCPDDRCKAIEENKLLYSDNHHVTKSGAELIMPELIEIIKK